MQEEEFCTSMGQVLPAGREETCTSSGTCKNRRFARIFQFVQSIFDCPLAPVQIICHLPDGIDRIYTAVLVCPPGALGKLGSAEEQPIEQLCIDGILASHYEARQRDKRRQRGSQFVKDDASLPFWGRTYRYSSSLCRVFSNSQISACRAFSSATSSS